MPAYVIAQLTFRDEAAYRRYQEAFASVFARSSGRLLVADERARVLEGTWAQDKVVVLEFPSAAAAQAFHEDPAYQAIAQDRRAGADGCVLLVDGVGLRLAQ